MQGRFWCLLAPLALVLAACGGDPCAELADICAACPAQNLGPVAKDSCDRTVRTGDADACQARVDDRTYEFLGGCVAPE